MLLLFFIQGQQSATDRLWGFFGFFGLCLVGFCHRQFLSRGIKLSEQNYKNIQLVLISG